MTRYALDADRGAIVAAWATGDGDAAATVATLPASCPSEKGFALVRTLSGLAEALWHTYTHPASAAGDDLEDNSEGWRRQAERDAFTDVLPALTAPNLPADGMIVQSYVAVEEGAHRVGRALHAIGDAALTKAVADEVGAEISAIERAELGDLSGRSRQAVVLTRADASPVQVAEADRLLREDPLRHDDLFTAVDPTAAAVAAAHWLLAAATVAAEAAGRDVVEVIAEAGDIEAMPVETPTIVLEMMTEDDASPYDAVMELIREAMAVAEGDLPDPIALVETVADIQDTAAKAAPGDEDLLEYMLASVRATPLDPARPALDLLEDLLAGIHGCALLFAEYVEVDTDDDDEGGDDDGEGDAAIVRAEFLDAVRAEAAAQARRLL